jgi:CRP-like cAMP-binding protein
MAKAKSAIKSPFEAEKYLQTAGVARKIESYRKGQTIFTQGEPCHSVMYIQSGGVKLAITSREGKEAVIALLQATTVAWKSTARYCGSSFTSTSPFDLTFTVFRRPFPAGQFSSGPSQLSFLGPSAPSRPKCP